MSRKVLGRIIACVLALTMVLGLFTMTSFADGNWSVSISKGKQEGVIGRTITIAVKGGNDAGVYSFVITPTNATASAQKITVSATDTTTFTVTPNVVGDGSVKIEPDTTVADNKAQGGAKTISFTTKIPTIELSKSTAEYDPYGNSFTVTVKNEAEDGALKVSGNSAILGNTVTVQGAGTYTVDYTKPDGTSYLNGATKIFTVTKLKPVFIVSNTTVTLREGTTAEIDYETTSGNTATSDFTCTSNDTNIATATVDPANKKIKITAVKAGSATVTVNDKGNANYSQSSSVGIAVNVVSSTATLITATPKYVTLDKDTSSQKVQIKVENADLTDGIAYVNVRVAKPTGTAYRGVYIDGNRKSAGNTYRVSPSGTTATFDITLKARYSGKYTLSISNGTNTVALPVVITGYNTLPQTGPDYSMVYIFAALLTVALGGIVLVNVLKKKDDYSK